MRRRSFLGGALAALALRAVPMRPARESPPPATAKNTTASDAATIDGLSSYAAFADAVARDLLASYGIAAAVKCEEAYWNGGTPKCVIIARADCAEASVAVDRERCMDASMSPLYVPYVSRTLARSIVGLLRQTP